MGNLKRGEAEYWINRLAAAKGCCCSGRALPTEEAVKAEEARTTEEAPTAGEQAPEQGQ